MTTSGVIFTLSSLLMTACLIYLVVKWPIGIHKTFSQHAAQSKALSIYYFLIFIVTMSAMSVGIWQWVSLQDPRFFGVFILFAFAAITQILCTLFPERGRSKQIVIHRIFAGMSAGLLFACSLLLSATTSSNLQGICITGIATMALVAFVSLFTKGKFALILQAAYYLAFFVPMAIALSA